MFVVKFLFRPKSDNNSTSKAGSGANTNVARVHYAILESINQLYQDSVTIYDNNNKQEDFSIFF